MQYFFNSRVKCYLAVQPPTSFNTASWKPKIHFNPMFALHSKSLCLFQFFNTFSVCEIYMLLLSALHLNTHFSPLAVQIKVNQILFVSFIFFFLFLLLLYCLSIMFQALKFHFSMSVFMKRVSYYWLPPFSSVVAFQTK